MNYLRMRTLGILLCHEGLDAFVDDILESNLPRDQFLEAFELALAEGFHDLAVDAVVADDTLRRSISKSRFIEWDSDGEPVIEISLNRILFI